ncbi:type II toxin-antitoxin system Phd/YefM family antitoxin [Cellulomonas fimi]|uniref:Antitoxin n=1 Tax=Cellulomonas fimi (strain ATCC 484 / DSM 20113 / JCM 1341 / CCUG 24087 / LMG 16345 / NBRC 15513 / NCIMB 8980 / NCTC 7547 / NRS-133) TaxID=590998 RepID=F4H7A3_CELFA|nr:type II toxin-antitoxin system Phd/YefM family antitoxin [Cellulomonas fimi]AEE46864.1 prevent-host-death family protein [Cellulomonas fimi ATCC 484]NNH06407.1 type II toxin-antitoxin system Phd/YefM family antitoxin [Cellulomonas fimi]VEH34403.1 Phd_YefM [Cellulomonas fimi]
MRTIGTRELKQNPHAVIEAVLASDQPIAITSHGRPTGVRLLADRPGPAPWVPGTALARLRTATTDDGLVLKAQIDAARDEDLVEDPWEPRR